MRLFIFEIRRSLRTLIFWGVSAVIVYFVLSQAAESYIISRPSPGMDSYGSMVVEDQKLIVPELFKNLEKSVAANEFITYPYGFYRLKTLEPSELEYINLIASELFEVPSGNSATDKIPNIPDKEKLESGLKKIDAILGGGSYFSPRRYINIYGNVGRNYEEALKDYNLMKKNGFDTAFARYFCDYAGIFTLLLTWFPVIFFWNKDKNEGINDVLSSKGINSFKFITSRVMAMAFLLMAAIFLLFTSYEIKMVKYYGMENLNPTGAYLIVTAWLFPIILTVISISTFISFLTGSIIPGFTGPVFSFFVIFSISSGNIFYNIGRGLMLRFNSIGNEEYFNSRRIVFFQGRMLWILISLLLIFFSSLIYDRRRRGLDVLDAGKYHKIRTKA